MRKEIRILRNTVGPKHHNTKTTAVQQWFFSAYWRKIFNMLFNSLSLLLIWSKENNYVDTFWSFNKIQGLGLRYVPRTTTRKPSLSNSDFPAPIGEISLICYFTLILKSLSISMIPCGEFGLILEWSSNGIFFQQHLKLI